MPSLEVLWTARYDYEPHWKLAPHSHAYFQMIYCLGGRGRFFFGNAAYPLEEGSAFLIKPERRHGLEPAARVKTLDVKFLVKDAGLRRRLVAASEVVAAHDSGIAGLFEQIRAEGERRGLLYREMCRVHLEQILIAYLRLAAHRASPEPVAAPDEIPADALVQRAVEFIRGNYALSIDSRAIAHACEHSERYLRTRFESSLSVTPMQYLAQYRVQKAKELIQYSDYALKEVAALVGFKTIHHFTRVFHELAGETPGAWRLRYRTGICKDVCIDPQFSNEVWTVGRG